MKVFYIHTGDFEGSSPSSTFVLNRVKGLLDNNIEVVLILKSSSEESTEEILKRKFDINEIHPNLKIYRISIKKDYSFFKEVKKIVEKTYEVGDVLFTRALGVLPYLYFLSKKLKLKVFFETHDFFVDLKLRDDIDRKKRIKQSLIERVFINRLTGLVCIGGSQAKVYKKYVKKPIIFSHCGIPKLYEKNETSEKQISYIGAIDEKKGISKIIELMEYLDDSYKLIIFGGKTKEEVDKFKKIIFEKKLENRIEITGWIDKKELNNRLKNVKLGLIPLNDIFFNKYLTYPLKVSDYFSHKIPLLTNDYQTTRDYIFEGKTGFFVDWENPEETAKIVKKIFSDEKIYRDLENGLNEYTANNMSQKTSERLINFFKECK